MPFARALTPSEFQAARARRRARSFASRHLSAPPSLDPDVIALAQRITISRGPQRGSLLFFDLLPVLLVAGMLLTTLAGLLCALPGFP